MKRVAVLLLIIILPVLLGGCHTLPPSQWFNHIGRAEAIQQARQEGYAQGLYNGWTQGWGAAFTYMGQIAPPPPPAQSDDDQQQQ